MAAPTLIEVVVGDAEYSRYEKGRDTIVASVTVSGGAPYISEQVVVELVKARRSRDAVVASYTLDISGFTDPYSEDVSFYLPDLVDQDMIHLVRAGKYFVRAVSLTDESVVGESADFDISIVTVDRLKSDFMFGIDLSATEIKQVKFQPQDITGVEISELSKSHPIGTATLNYHYHTNVVSNASVSIGSGANGTVLVGAQGAFAGSAGNALTAEVVVPVGTSALSATLVGTTLVVNLDVTAGVPNPGANTAALVAAAIDSIPDLVATASGSGSDPLTAAEGPTQFSGGVTNTVRQANWNGGPLVSLTKPGTYTLLMGASGPASKFAPSGKDYVILKVKSLLSLPTEPRVETLVIDKKTIDDETLRRFISQSVDWVERDFLASPIEPTQVTTSRDPTTIQYSAGMNAPSPVFSDSDYDLIVSPLTYFVPKTSTWVTIQFPWPQLLRVDSLFGAIAGTRVIDIDVQWIEHSEQGGLVQLVPFNQEIAFDFMGLVWVNALRGAAELPNFWNYRAIVGLRDASPVIQELVAKKAAIDALTVAGLALRPGVGSVSLSRDGVSESVSYTTSAQYGVYTGVITAYKEWIETRGKEIRAKVRGVTMAVV